MTTPQAGAEGRQGLLERLLRSWAGRTLLVGLGVLALAGANTLELSNALGGRRFGPAFDESAFLLSQLVRWGLWGVVVLLGIVPVMQAGGRWPLPIRALSHVALAAVATWGVGAGWDALRPLMPPALSFADDEGPGREERPRRPREAEVDPGAADTDAPSAGSEGRRVEPGASALGIVEPEASAPGNAEPEASTPGIVEPPVEEGVEPGPASEPRRAQDLPEDEADGRRPRRPGRFDPRRARGGLGREDVPLRRWVTHALLLLACAGAASHLRSEEARRQAASLALERAELSSELTSAQLASLEAQLRPHFLFNALHSVGALMRLDRSEEARTALVTLGDLLRGTLDRSRTGRSSLHDELELCTSYLDLERLRHGERLTCSSACPEELRGLEVPPLILLPLVENAIRHGLEQTVEPVEVRIHARCEGNSLALVVENDGAAFPEDVLRAGEGAGIGLANTRKRLGTLYGERGSMALENPATGGARVVLRLPL